MDAPEKVKESPKAAAIASGITLLASTLLFPKVRKGIKHTAPAALNIVKRADDPSELKDAAKNEVKEQAAEEMKEKFKEGIQSKVKDASAKLKKKKDENAEKVHSNAEKVERKAQNALLMVREKVSNAKDAGEEFQDKMKQKTRSDSKIPGANDIKGVNQIKSSSNIKSSTNIKGPQDIKHHSDLNSL